ncbi:hypothetical protein [Paenibacillus sp. PAMC21692]|uniref:hypothetical protein n=1 Tax=Paenibacillus sp. PAMC21692 TaxID=2762320 RepID=UPI00164E7E3A|nr:hypothetical protein [Paenibacillus sp. PAMC21692]QNK58562.1 hypothetical protein H7F31_06550 [Paenibacillus sp. PAMC21692]
MKMAKIGIYLDSLATARIHQHHANVFQLYIQELMTFAGIPFRSFDSADKMDAGDFDVVIAALTGGMESESSLWDFAERGGIVISFAGLPYLAARLGCRQLQEVPVGYASLSGEPGGGRPMRYFRARPWLHTSSDAGSLALSCEEDGMVRVGAADGAVAGPLLQTFRVGKGIIARWAVDIPTLIVRLQQGELPVYEDGIPAQDGSGALTEGILKADDQCQLDWEADRTHTATGMPYYEHPYADYWREAFMHQLLSAASASDLIVPFVDYWPAGVEAVAMISHDSDFNSDDAGRTTLEVLSECGVRSTWCMIEPGYSPELYPMIREAGHELALHYNALEIEQGIWSQEEFNRQASWFKKATGLPAATSNKNHYTRFEGWGELFRWCEEAGIQSDQTRGPSKKGNVGFPFCTSHPYFPIAWADEYNRLYDVLEIGFLTQDLMHPALSDTSVIAPFLEKVMEVRGVAHFLYHQKHIHELPEVRKALVTTASEAKKLGFEFWTGAEINDWVRAKRELRIIGLGEGGRLRVEGERTAIAAYRPLLAGESSDGAVKRFGLPCVLLQVEFGGASQQQSVALSSLQ